uniref:Ribonuclease A-domain domain-containing protein n=1 Tax=Cyprinodon variegatus TaxID=28743 RepID=A0A3Q2FS01_CYPVA
MKILPETPYEKFKRQHIDNNMTANKCTAVMHQKRIYSYDRSCKKINTFILAAARDVKSICQGQGSERDGRTFSENRFSAVVCRLTGRNTTPMCDYEGTLYTNRTIVVDCHGLPVHFERSIQLPKVFNY